MAALPTQRLGAGAPECSATGNKTQRLGAGAPECSATGNKEPVLRKPVLPSISGPNPFANCAPHSGDSDANAPKPQPRDTRPSFQAVGNSIKLSIRIANGFATLRDMGGACVQPGELKIVRRLGQGAFAFVDEAQYNPAPLSPSDPGGGGSGGTGTGTSSPAEPGAGDAAGPGAAALPSPSGAGGSDGAGGGGAGAAAATPVVATPSSRRVAVKRLKPEIVDQKADLEAFLKEIAIMRKLANKRIVEFIGVGSMDTSSEESRLKTMFLVQEFMDGGTLKKMVSRQMIDVGRQLYSYLDAFRWAIHMAEGLEYLHGAHPVVIHRDLKLENILLKGTDPSTADAKIADFGLVALVRPRQREAAERLRQADSLRLQLSASATASASGESKNSATLQRPASRRKTAVSVQELWNQSFMLAQSPSGASARSCPPQQLSGRTGSYMYMAPEMYKQQEYNEKVDVFSYGVILFELFGRYMMVCAVSLAGTEAEIESYAAKVAEGYRPPLPARWPQPLRDLIASCWHQDPAERPSMAMVRRRLQELQAAGVADEMQATLKPPSRCGCAVM